MNIPQNGMILGMCILGETEFKGCRYTVSEYHGDMKTIKEVRKYKTRSMSHSRYGTLFFGCGTRLPDRAHFTLEYGKWEYYDVDGGLVRTERKRERFVQN